MVERQDEKQNWRFGKSAMAVAIGQLKTGFIILAEDFERYHSKTESAVSVVVGMLNNIRVRSCEFISLKLLYPILYSNGLTSSMSFLSIIHAHGSPFLFLRRISSVQSRIV
jgi:hypothetical protein